MSTIDQNVLMNDISKYLYTFADAYCRKAEIEITKAAKAAIEQFYDDYSPHEYIRTYNLQKNSYEPYYHNNGKTIYGGVAINSNKMKDNYNIDPKYVVDAGWHGWHGSKGDSWMNNDMGNFNPIYTTPPLDMVKEVINDKGFLKNLEEHANSVASSQTYQVLQGLM